jgi:hypothetical protein
VVGDLNRLNNGFLRRGQLLDSAPRMAGMPVVIVHGRCDYVCRPAAAYLLSKALEPDKVHSQAATLGGSGSSESFFFFLSYFFTMTTHFLVVVVFFVELHFILLFFFLFFFFFFLPQVRLEMVAGAGHSDSEEGIIDGLVRATDDFRHDDGQTPGQANKPPQVPMTADAVSGGGAEATSSTSGGGEPAKLP